RPEGNVDLIFEVAARLGAFLSETSPCATPAAEDAGEDVAKTAAAASRVRAAAACAFEHVAEIESAEVKGDALTCISLPAGESTEAAASARSATRVGVGG